MHKTESPRRRAKRVAAFVLALLAPLLARAERLESPLELIYAPAATLVAGSIVSIDPAGRVVIERKDVLAGKERAPARIDARVRTDALPRFKAGDKVVVAYSIYERDPRKAVGTVLNPEGAVVLDSTGIEPALFHDSPALRAILKAGRSEHGRESRRLFRLVLEALRGEDPVLQNLAAAELALEPELAERLGDEERAAVEKAVLDRATDPRARLALLDAALRRPAQFGDWGTSAALKIVTTTPVDGYPDGASGPVALVLAALEVLDQRKIAVSSDVLRRWVWNANPAVVERACVMLRKESPAAERSTIEIALADPKLPDSTRRFLKGHLGRLDRLDARRRAKKEGTG